MKIHLPTIEALLGDGDAIKVRGQEASKILLDFSGLDTSTMTAMDIELIMDDLKAVQKLKIREKLCAR